MIKLYADYHTHTVYSHGKGNIMENVEAAVEKGLKEICISDHGPGHFSYGVKHSSFKEMREEIDVINKKVTGIKVLLGVEANLTSMDGDIDIREEDKKYLDILLMGYHTAVIPKSIRDAKGLYFDNLWAKISPSVHRKARLNNTRAMINAINKHHIDIITHPGLNITIDTVELAEAAAKSGTALEINSSHGFLTVEYVKAAMKQGVNFVINSDAHNPRDIGNFTKGIQTAQEAGLPVDRIINAVKDWE
ncbi:DNA polymerase/3'-5' exonuclease PolX [Oxobacter pfennigii]|uniref:DNA polymerase/3'-5' exonuclease PolX n=1 Tax=Oxobacter pfennigii TaxID=36849 RepID=A0A0P8Y9E5_9CLOT|nr:PHP domain-containing protein [Oxobacter pfennigii]KPU43435.1 DNA polymerase/3'-5' exonuclease PolX [Oxobacter pfennigii]